MGSPELQRQIAALTAALSSVSSVDESTRALLAALHTQLTRLTDESVAQRLEALAIRFEADHPTAGVALRQAIDALSKAGI